MSNQFIRRIAKSIAKVWSSDNDLEHAVILFEPSAVAAINELMIMIDEQYEPAYDFLLRIQDGLTKE